MKKNSLLFILFIIFLSCKKESIKIEDGMYIRFEVNGIKKEFREHINGTISDGYNRLKIFGGEACKTKEIIHQDAISLSLSSQEIIVGREYVYKIFSNNFISFIYLDEKGNRHDILSKPSESASDQKINIVSLSNDELKGIFSGTVYNTNNPNDTHFLSGSFSLRD